MAERPMVAKIGLVVVLALVLAVVALRQFVLPATGSKSGHGSVVPAPNADARSTPGPNASGAPAASAPVQMAWKRPEPVGPVARDPMHLDLSRQASPEPNADSSVRPSRPGFTVTGIVYSTEQPSSIIIEGRILHEGDTIYGATVARISENGVEFSAGDKRWTVKAGEQTTNPP